MPKVRVLKRHGHREGIGVYSKGDVYECGAMEAKQKVDGGFVEMVSERKPAPVQTKESPAMYQRADDPLRLESVNGNWFAFSDGQKVLGRTKAAERLGVSVDDLEGIIAHVDSNDG